MAVARAKRLQIMLTATELAAVRDWRFARQMPTLASAVGRSPNLDDRPRRWVMPMKQSSELDRSDIERLRARLRETLHDIEEFETRLQDEERKCGIIPAPSKPVVERMAAVGMPREAIDQLADMLDTLTQIAPRIEIIPGLN